LMQGVLSSCVKEGSNTFYSPRSTPNIAQYVNHANAKLHNFLSPEVNFLKKQIPSGSIQAIGSCSFVTTADQAGTGYNLYNWLKLNSLNTLTKSSTPSTIVESRIVPPGYEAQYTINNFPYKNYRWNSSNEFGYMCTNMVMAVSGSIDVTGFTVTEYIIANIVKTLSNQYGGQSYSGRLNNKYIDCRQTITNDVSTVYGGDTFIGYFDLLYGIFDLTGNVTHNNQQEYFFPIETSINLTLRHDICPSKADADNYMFQETAGTHTTALFSGQTFTQQTDLYLYNQVYSRENDVISYFSKPLNFSNNKTFDARILSSEVKRTNEEIDSWTTFLATNYVDVDATYGPINKIVTFGKRLYFFQDKALGWASVNERSLITPDSTGAVLSLGNSAITTADLLRLSIIVLINYPTKKSIGRVKSESNSANSFSICVSPIVIIPSPFMEPPLGRTDP